MMMQHLNLYLDLFLTCLAGFFQTHNLGFSSRHDFFGLYDIRLECRYSSLHTGQEPLCMLRSSLGAMSTAELAQSLVRLTIETKFIDAGSALGFDIGARLFSQRLLIFDSLLEYLELQHTLDDLAALAAVARRFLLDQPGCI